LLELCQHFYFYLIFFFFDGHCNTPATLHQTPQTTPATTNGTKHHRKYHNLRILVGNTTKTTVKAHENFSFFLFFFKLNHIQHLSRHCMLALSPHGLFCHQKNTHQQQDEKINQKKMSGKLRQQTKGQGFKP
jgi:hypothetical protein